MAAFGTPDRGTKWLLGHPHHLRHLLRILAAEVSNRIDFDHLEPLPNELLSESLRKQLADLVFTAPFRDETQGEVTIFLLVEHQSTPSPVMRLRVLSYMVQLFTCLPRMVSTEGVFSLTIEVQLD